MGSQWAWLRNLGISTMAVAIAMWVFGSGSTLVWLAALFLWVIGCAVVSAAGLAVLHNFSKQPERQEAAPAKAKSAAA